jgi:hypothetical protein
MYPCPLRAGAISMDIGLDLLKTFSFQLNFGRYMYI